MNNNINFHINKNNDKLSEINIHKNIEKKIKK